MQITVRSDDARKAIMYDFIEYKPSLTTFLLTNRSVGRFQKAFDMGGHSGRFGFESDDDGSDEEDEEFLNKEVEPKNEDDEFDAETKIKLNFQGVAGDFAHSRIFRYRSQIKDIAGIRLQKVDDAESDELCPAVLILEYKESKNNGKTVSYFCAKRVQSKFQAEEQWQVIDDFTPNEVASKATRHHIYASLQESKQFVAHLCTLCPRIKGLVAAKDNETNTLSIQTGTAYTSSPSFVEKDLKASACKKQKVGSENINFPLTVEQVENLLEQKGLGHSNDCLKRAILYGRRYYHSSWVSSHV